MTLEREKVLDSSVVLAVLRKEPTDVDLLELIDGGVISSVTLSEIFTKATQWGVVDSPLLARLLESLDRIVPFTSMHARTAAGIWEEAPHISLGDRACLALAIELGADVYTADRVWASLQVGCDIRLIR
jgi:PIN domain nuclease of toxin-antitoxin system